MGCVNGGFFAETLSFGLDAAIAIDTMERRKRMGRHGAALYMASGFDQLFHHLDQREYRLQLDDGPVMEGKSITFAVQMGPYYGGGFRICPDARLDDGLLDVCISHPPITPAGAAAIFLMAKGGNHTRLSCMELHQARKVHVEFDEPPAAPGRRRAHRSSNVRCRGVTRGFAGAALVLVMAAFAFRCEVARSCGLRLHGGR